MASRTTRATVLAFKTLAVVLVAIAVLAGAAIAVGNALWAAATRRAVARLEARRRPSPRARVAAADLQDLPAPVARYFAFALAPGQPPVARAEIRHRGEFALRPGAWSPFTSTEVFVVHPPGFLWDATIRMAGVVPVRVHDGYDGGAGALRAAVAGLLTVAEQRDTPEMAQGELMRYLAEAVWLPTALLPASGVEWAAIDDRSARATLRDGAASVSLEVRFGARGEIAAVSARRPRLEGSTAELTPWSGAFADYAQVQGMQVPMTAEAGWDLPGGHQAYWRGRIVDVRYVFEP